MIANYEIQKHIAAAVKYRRIRSITRKCDVFTLCNAFGVKKDVDYRTAVDALVGVYYHFLVEGGLFCSSIPVAEDPSLICLNLTKDERPGGTPVLSEDETEGYLGCILNGLYCFHNRRCRNTAILQGMAYLVRRIYEPYMGFGNKMIHELYYAIIARGAFVLQMNNKMLAKAFYKGLYDQDPRAKEQQRYFFGGMSLDAQAVYDSVLIHEDLFFDPIHEARKYPWNMYEYNVDNLILTYCAAKGMREAGEKTKCFTPEEIRLYGLTMDFIHDFFTNVSPFYKVRCDYYNARHNPNLRLSDPVEYYNNVNTAMEKYKTLNMDYCPFLFYSCELFRSSEKPESWLYMGIAGHYTGRDYDSLDKDCPVFGERFRRTGEVRDVLCSLVKAMDLWVMGCIAVIIGMKVIEWELRMRLSIIVFCIIISVVIAAFAGSFSDS